MERKKFIRYLRDKGCLPDEDSSQLSEGTGEVFINSWNNHYAFVPFTKGRNWIKPLTATKVCIDLGIAPHPDIEDIYYTFQLTYCHARKN